MECRNCGCTGNDGTNFCANCGSCFSNSWGSYRTPYSKPNPALSALVLGILGLAICLLNFIISPFLHLIGLGLGIAAIMLGKKGAGENAPFSIAAMIAGLIAVVFSIIGTFIFACNCALACGILDCSR